MTATPRDPHTIIGRMTRYSVILWLDGQPDVIGFTARPSARALLACARMHTDRILPYLTETDRTAYSRNRLTLGHRVYLTIGDTERQIAHLHTMNGHTAAQE